MAASLGFFVECLDDLVGDIDGLIVVEDLRAFEDQGEFFRLADLANNLLKLLQNIIGHLSFFLAELLLVVLSGALVAEIASL
jgi:hypothetical protein